jgi:hypothetical protein
MDVDKLGQLVSVGTHERPDFRHGATSIKRILSGRPLPVRHDKEDTVLGVGVCRAGQITPGVHLIVISGTG